MLKRIHFPASFFLIEKGRALLLLKEEYKDFLLNEGIVDLKTFIEKKAQDSRYMTGRKPHLSVPIADGKRMVLRQYAHGGLLRAVTRNAYLFGTRSFRELTFTEEVRSCGIPTIQPIGAIHHFALMPFYRAYLLTLEIPGAMDFVRYFQEVGPNPSPERLAVKRKVLRSAALLLRQFHHAGFFHGDLQLKNILVAGDQPLLIDFDRSYRKPALSVRERMKNLLRLNRSAEKWKRMGLPITRTDRWRFFLAYAGEDTKIREAMEKAVRTYSIRHLFYRFGWALEGSFSFPNRLKKPS
jgi:hypothetical protein